MNLSSVVSRNHYFPNKSIRFQGAPSLPKNNRETVLRAYRDALAKVLDSKDLKTQYLQLLRTELKKEYRKDTTISPVQFEKIIPTTIESLNARLQKSMEEHLDNATGLPIDIGEELDIGEEPVTLGEIIGLLDPKGDWDLSELKDSELEFLIKEKITKVAY